MSGASLIPAQDAAARGLRPLRWWSDAALERVGRAAAAVWADWGERWGVPGATVRVTNVVAGDASPSQVAWRRILALPAWIGSGDDGPSVSEAMRALLFGRDADLSPLAVASEVAATALDDLLGRFHRLLATGSPATVPAAAMAAGEALPPGGRQWSGDLRLHFDVAVPTGTAQWILHCDSTLAATLCGTSAVRAEANRAPLADITSAIEHRAMSLRVELQPTTLTLGALQSLHLGDVLTLSHRLDQPMRVVDPTSLVAPDFCAAYLGRRGDHRAVEIVTATPTTTESTE